MLKVQNPDLQQLLQMWRAGRVSLLAVVLNYVLSSVSTKLGAGAPPCRASCLCCTQSAKCLSCLLPPVLGSLLSAVCESYNCACVEHVCSVAKLLTKPHGTVLCIKFEMLCSMR